MSTALRLARMQNFSQPFRQTWRAKYLRKEQKRLARIIVSRDRQETAAQFRIGGKLFRAGVEPRIDLGVHRTKRGLQLRRVAFRIVHQKTRIDAEEARQQRARAVREMRPRAALDLREVGLAKAAAYFLFHGLGQLLLRHRTAQAAQGTFHGAERTEFVTESHRRTHLLQSANTLLLFAILCQELYLPYFQYFTDMNALSMRALVVTQHAGHHEELGTTARIIC